MPLVTRMILILTLAAALATAAFGQEAASATTTAATETTATTTSTGTAGASSTAGEAPVRDPYNSHETRSQFFNLLSQHPPELGTILTLDPTLLSNDAFLSSYPELSRFVSAHPEVRRNPRFFLDNFEIRRNSTLNDIMEGLFILSMFIFFAFVLSWLLRTIVEQRRWSRLARTQSEVHNKILDRFGTSGELLEYMKTPAGTKFLESAPIPLREAPASQNAPVSRVMWSIQLGIVVAAGAIGMLLVSSRFDAETSKGLFAMGAIALCVGLGFIVSAFVSVMVSRRLGVLQSPEVDALADSGPVR
jgi:small-conductance mechanosensitive channel